MPHTPAALFLYPDCGDQIRLLRNSDLRLMFAGDTRVEQDWKELVILSLLSSLYRYYSELQ